MKLSVCMCVAKFHCWKFFHFYMNLKTDARKSSVTCNWRARDHFWCYSLFQFVREILVEVVIMMMQFLNEWTRAIIVGSRMMEVNDPIKDSWSRLISAVALLPIISKDIRKFLNIHENIKNLFWFKFIFW